MIYFVIARAPCLGVHNVLGAQTEKLLYAL